MLERIQKLESVDGMQFSFILGRRMTDALFVVRRIREE